jgi:hypothetical protein
MDTAGLRQVRAAFDAATITVYQAYGHPIADAALATGRLVTPFRLDRMTWIKPSFLWLMHRSDWARSPGQERILAMRISRAGFEWALSRAVTSAFAESGLADHDAWRRELLASPVRVQWDPDRSLVLERLDRRAIQVGLAGEAIVRYASEWTVEIRDVTELAREIHRLVERGELDAARSCLTPEAVYPLPPEIAARIGSG